MATEHHRSRGDVAADDRARIKRLIERWASAVHSGDMSGVLADHSDDIVMFDVPVVTHEHHSFPDAGGGDDQAAAAEQEVLALHRHWYDRTAAKDLDGLMSHIADDVVSYEHDEPLQYLGVDSVREVCRRGLDAASGAVGWDVPDLKILVRDDIAVAWGLNRMRAQQPDGRTDEHWSRGTRVFQKVDGSWSMIHQHVSYPHDPRTGEARTDLRP
jgi:ketosteroid isomerase-like protein